MAARGIAVTGNVLDRPTWMRASAGARVAGVAWNCKILSVKIMDADVNKAQYPGRDDDIGYGPINMGRALIVDTLTR